MNELDLIIKPNKDITRDYRPTLLMNINIKTFLKY